MVSRRGSRSDPHQLFPGGAIGFAGVPQDFTSVSRGLGHRFRQRADREIHAGAHIQERRILRAGLPAFQSKHAGLAQIIHMQELPQRGAGAPAGHARGLGFSGLVEAADQGREHMAVFRVVVVARPIQVGGQLLRRRLRLQADRIEAVLFAQRFAKLQARDQAPHPGSPGRFDHMGLDLEVFQQKIRRVAVVGLDTAHLRGG